VYSLADFPNTMMFLIAIWGVLFTLGLNISQNWITSAAPEAPEFTNGLFVAFANLGITIGTFIGGMFISGMGTHYVVWAGILFLALSFVTIALRAFMYSPKKATYQPKQVS
jgi:MFS transporter, DHA1 family, inner membrane transport protein